MKRIVSFCIGLLLAATSAYTQALATQGDYSPAVVAKDFHATYGVRADAVQAILGVYARKGLSAQERKARTENLIQSYSTTISNAKGVQQLTPEDKQRLGIATEPGLVAALNWDLFAKQHYLSTAGAYSPAIVAKGDVNIWFGIPEGALRTLAGRLEANEVELAEFEKELSELAGKYAELKKEFEIYGPSDPVVRQAEALLNAGRLEEAEALLDADYHASKKRLAYKAYLYGKTKELLLKYEEAAEGYRDAVGLDSGNVEYLIASGVLQLELGNISSAQKIFEGGVARFRDSDFVTRAQRMNLYFQLGMVFLELGENQMAIDNFEFATRIDSIPQDECNSLRLNILRRIANCKRALTGNKEMELVSLKSIIDSIEDSLGVDSWLYAAILTNIGNIYSDMENYSNAINYYERTMRIDSAKYGSIYKNLGAQLSNIGLAYCQWGNHEMGKVYLERALSADKFVWGPVHPKTAGCYINLGYLSIQMEEDERAISFFEEAMEIDLQVYGITHPLIPLILSNIGGVFWKQGEIEGAIALTQMAWAIDTVILNPNHPDLACDLNNLAYYYESFAKNRKEGKLHIPGNFASKLRPNPKLDSILLQGRIATSRMSQVTYFEILHIYEHALEILSHSTPTSHTWSQYSISGIIKASTECGSELAAKGLFSEALSYYRKAYLHCELKNNKRVKINILQNITTTQIQLKNYPATLETIEKATHLADSLSSSYLEAEKSLPDSIKTSRKYLAERDSMLFRPILRELQFHKITALAALDRKKEAKAIAKHLIPEAIAAKDEEVLQLLKEDGWMRD